MMGQMLNQMGNFATFMQDTHKANIERVAKEKEEREKKEEKDKEEKEKKEEKEAEKERRYEEKEAEKERRYEEKETEKERRYEEKEAENERRYEEKEKREREERQYAYQYMTRQDNKNQTVPQSVITGGTSEVNFSTITATSNSQIVVSPRRAYIRIPRKD